MFLLTSKLRVKYLIGVLLLLTFLIVTTVFLLCLSEESDIRILRNKEANNKTEDGQESTTQTEEILQILQIQNGDQTNESVPTTEGQPTSFEDNYQTEDYIVTTEQTKTEHPTEESATSEIWPTTEEILISLEADNYTNEDQAITNKPRTALEARKAYFAVHGLSVSENKCMEFERNRCEFMEEYGKKLVDLFKRPVIPGNADRFGTNARDIAIGVFPHMGALAWLDTTNKWVFKCVSSLISPKFLLTAAHCTWLSPKKYNLIDPKPKIVRLGNQNILERDSNDYLDVTIEEIIVHPAYKSPIKYSDIALMKLIEEVEFNAHIAPACLTRNPTVGIGDEVSTTGWKDTTTGVTGDSSLIQSMDIKIIDSSVCDGIFKIVKDTNFRGIRSHQLCAGNIKQDIDTCQEDSTRFVQVTDARVCLFDVPLFTLIGVTSFGLGCGLEGMPSVYTRVSNYVDWIEEIVWKEELNL